MLTQVISVFTYKPIIDIIAEVLTKKDNQVYELLMEEFKTEASEFRITIHEKLLEEKANNEKQPSKNIFREAIFEYLNSKDTDLLVLPASCLISVLMKNQSIFFSSFFWKL